MLQDANFQGPRIEDVNLKSGCWGEHWQRRGDIDYLVPYDEPILEYQVALDDDTAPRIGKYVSRLIEDGDTIQVG